MPLDLAVIIEHHGIELYRHPYQMRQPGGAASALADAYRGFREKVSADGIEDGEITLRFERSQRVSL
jgi:hypothetical protein